MTESSGKASLRKVTWQMDRGVLNNSEFPPRPPATLFHQLFGSFLLCVLFTLEQEDGEGNQGDRQGGKVGVRVAGERD